MDLPQVLSLIGKIGSSAPLIFLPIAMMSVADAQGWNLCFIEVPRRFTFAEAFLVRVGTDALHNSLPAGVALAETVRPVMANRMHDIPYRAGIAAGVVSKINTAVSQIIFFIVGLTLLGLTMSNPGAELSALRSSGTYVVMGIISAVVIALLWLPYKGTTFRTAYRILYAVPVSRLRNMLETHHESFIRIDDYIKVFATHHRAKLYASLFLFLIGWFATALETYLIVTLLGYSITLPQAIAIESSVSFIRVLFFFIPAGLGAQEAGFVTLFTAFRFPGSVEMSAAFVIVRRFKEFLWIAFGYSILGFLKVNPFKQSAPQTL